jgi:hypothetical protein
MTEAMAAMIESRCASKQHASPSSTPATSDAQTAVVAMPSSTEPPYASANPSTEAPAHQASAPSMSGTATQAKRTVAATKASTPGHDGVETASVPRCATAASQQCRNPRSASVTASTTANAAINPRDPWLATSSNVAWGTR